jgi:transposase-like protein
MIAERGLAIDCSAVHRWVIKLLPVFEKAFPRHKRPAGRSWQADETYLKVWGKMDVSLSRRGQGRQRNRLSAERTAQQSCWPTLLREGHRSHRVPDTVTIDKSRADLAARHAVNAERETPIRIRQRKYPNEIIEQDHRPSSDEHGRCWASRTSAARASLWRGST